MKIFRLIYKYITAKDYGVGDPLPSNLKLSKLDCLDVYQAKLFLKIINQLGIK